MIGIYRAAAAAIVAAFVGGGCAQVQRADGEGGQLAKAREEACLRAVLIYDKALYDSFSYNFTDADAGFVELLGLYDDDRLQLEAYCPQGAIPGRRVLIADRAVALSNQEQYFVANALLQSLAGRSDGAAAADSDQTLSPDERVRLLTARAIHEFNASQGQGFSADTVQKVADTVEQARAELRKGDARAMLTSSRVDGGASLIAIDRRAILISIAETQLDFIESSVEVERGNYQEALFAISRALDKVSRRSIFSKSYAPRFLLQQAIVYMAIGAAAGNPEDAARAHHQALDAADAAIERIVELFGNTPIHARALMLRARALLLLQREDEAFEQYAKAFDIYQESTASVSYQSMWAFFSAAMDLLNPSPQAAPGAQPVGRDRIERELFRGAQIVRSSLAAKAIAQSLAIQSAQGEDTELGRLLNEFQAASEEYRRLTIRSVIAGDSSTRGLINAGQLSAELKEATERRARARQALDALGDAAGDYLSVAGRPASLEAVRETLRPGEALVMILNGEPMGLVMVIGKNADDFTAAFTTPKTPWRDAAEAAPHHAMTDAKLVETMLRSQKELGVDENGAEGLYDFDFIAAFTAYQRYLAPVEEALENRAALVFSVNGPLSGAPIDLLVSNLDNAEEVFAGLAEKDYSAVRWFGQNALISYVPSPRNLVDLRKREARTAAKTPVVVFSAYEGPPDDETAQQAEIRALLATNGFDPDMDPQSACAVDARSAILLPAIDADGANGAAITGKFGARATPFLGVDGFNAQRLRSLSADFGAPRILHLNTHGILWGKGSCFVEPALTVNVAGGSDPAEAGGDRLLTSSEIQKFGVAADLVVLSACDTAGGDGVSGESLSGLARSFFIAQSRAVVASHWSVDEGATDRFMQAMYARLAQDDGVAFETAVSAARAEMRAAKETSHPFYWAPFVLIGDGARGLGAQ